MIIRNIMYLYKKNDTNLFSAMDFVFLLHVFAMETNLEQESQGGL